MLYILCWAIQRFTNEVSKPPKSESRKCCTFWCKKNVDFDSCRSTSWGCRIALKSEQTTRSPRWYIITLPIEIQYIHCALREYGYNTPVGHLTLLCSWFHSETCDISGSQNKASINAFLLFRFCGSHPIAQSVWVSPCKGRNNFCNIQLLQNNFY